MKIKGKLIFKSSSKNKETGQLVETIVGSLSPDNLSGMETLYYEDSAAVIFSADKIGTILSSVDDYLMNAKIASDIITKKGQEDVTEKID